MKHGTWPCRSEFFLLFRSYLGYPQVNVISTFVYDHRHTIASNLDDSISMIWRHDTVLVQRGTVSVRTQYPKVKKSMTNGTSLESSRWDKHSLAVAKRCLSIKSSQFGHVLYHQSLHFQKWIASLSNENAKVKQKQTNDPPFESSRWEKDTLAWAKSSLISL